MEGHLPWKRKCGHRQKRSGFVSLTLTIKRYITGHCHQMSRLNGQHPWLLFGRLLFRISSGKPHVLAEVSHYFPQSLDAISGPVPQKGHHRFLPNPSEFMIHRHSNVSCLTDQHGSVALVIALVVRKVQYCISFRLNMLYMFVVFLDLSTATICPSRLLSHLSNHS
jgi:hypothetical protein